jgi:hypothetical protein
VAEGKLKTMSDKPPGAEKKIVAATYITGKKGWF